MTQHAAYQDYMQKFGDSQTIKKGGDTWRNTLRVDIQGIIGETVQRRRKGKDAEVRKSQ